MPRKSTGQRWTGWRISIAGKHASAPLDICSGRDRMRSSRPGAQAAFRPKALSVAEEEGRNGVWLAEQGLDVLSVDFSPTALAKARTLAADRGAALRTVEADLAAWSWPAAAFDVVVAIFVPFASPALRSGIFAGKQRALKPG